MNARAGLLTLLAALPVAAQPPPETPSAPDTSAWVCKFCAFESGSQQWVDAGVGFVSDDSVHYGDYTGLDEQGGYLDIGGGWRYRGEDTAEAWDLRAERLALDSRAISLRGGKQGTYRVTFGYDEIPHLRVDGGRTPYDGGAQLALPGGWVTGGSTAGMSGLDAALHGAGFGIDRKRTLLGVSVFPESALDFDFSYRRDAVSGTDSIGGSILTLAAELPRPVDQVTDRFEITTATRGELGLAQLTLSSSFFTNDVAALTWQNAYNPPAPGATAGRMGTAPDNEAHQLSLALSLPQGSRVQGSAQLALGRMLQNQRFLPATINPDEATALPRNSLDGRVDTTLASARAAYRLWPTVRLTADVLHDDRDNKTPSADYVQVVMDTFTGGTRANVPYSYTRDRFRLGVERSGKLRLAGGITQDSRDRTLATHRDTREWIYWGRAGWRPQPGAELRVRLAHLERDGSANTTVAAGVPAQNPRLRTFQAADRRRDEARADVTLAGGPLTTSFDLSYGHNEYPDTSIGRTDDRDFGYGTQLGAQWSEALSLHLFASHLQRDYDEAGSQTFAAPDWFADLAEVSTALGAGAAWRATGGLELGADYTVSRAEEAIDLTAAGSGSAFPLRVSRWQGMRLYGLYPVTPQITARLELERDVYQASDWALDGVDPATVPNLLSLGQGTREGSVTAGLVTVRYRF